jgi:hypothetical protein
VRFINDANRFQCTSVLVASTLVLLIGSAAMAIDISVAAGPEGIAAGPVSFSPETSLEPSRAYTLVFGEGQFAAQTDADGKLYWWTEKLAPNQTVSGKLQPARTEPRVKVEKQGDEQIEIKLDRELFTTLNFKKNEPRIYLYPVVGPTGVGVTRDFVMRDNPVEKDNDRQDHHHHRSLWTAWGDVRVGDLAKKGYDFWAEGKDRSLPRQVLTKVIRMESGPVFGQIEAEVEWRNPEGQRLFTENRTYTFFAGDKDQRVIDAKIAFKFNDMDVKFADTKEGGLLALRLAVTMDEVGTKTPKELRGQMTNSRGGVGAKECWGKPAEWCDYVGPLGGQTVGVAVFDHPKNLRHPTTWHIRDYGLYTANPFGLKDFTGDKSQDGSQVWKKGESAEFQYRVVIHKGDTKAAEIADQWQDYKSPPKVNLK